MHFNYNELIAEKCFLNLNDLHLLHYAIKILLSSKYIKKINYNEKFKYCIKFINTLLNKISLLYN